MLMAHMISYISGIDVYVAELMVESNVTLEAQVVLSVLKTISDLQVTDGNGVSHTVTLQNNELVAGIVLVHYCHYFVFHCRPNSYFYTCPVMHDLHLLFVCMPLDSVHMPAPFSSGSFTVELSGPSTKF